MPRKIGRVEREAVGITEVWRVSRYGSGHFLRIPKNLIDVLELRPGDRLRLRIETVYRVSGKEEVSA